MTATYYPSHIPAPCTPKARHLPAGAINTSCAEPVQPQTGCQKHGSDYRSPYISHSCHTFNRPFLPAIWCSAIIEENSSWRVLSWNGGKQELDKYCKPSSSVWQLKSRMGSKQESNCASSSPTMTLYLQEISLLRDLEKFLSAILWRTSGFVHVFQHSEPHRSVQTAQEKQFLLRLNVGYWAGQGYGPLFQMQASVNVLVVPILQSYWCLLLTCKTFSGIEQSGTQKEWLDVTHFDVFITFDSSYKASDVLEMAALACVEIFPFCFCSTLKPFKRLETRFCGVTLN